MFIALFVCVNVLVSCSDDNQTVIDKRENVIGSAFLNSYYSGNFRLGKSVEVNIESLVYDRSVATKNYVFTEVFVGDENIARGYSIADKSNDEFVYFVDVDRIGYKFTSFDVKSNITNVYYEINELDDYYSTNEFDFMKIIEGGNYEQPEPGQIAERKRYTYGQPFKGVDGYCHQGVYEAKYFLGIRVSKVQPVIKENGSTAQVLCGMEYKP